MAYTERFLPGNGTGPYAIGFNYLSADSIGVTVNGAPVGFSFAGTPSVDQPGGTSVVLAVGTTSEVRIFKAVDLDTPVIDWTAGAELSEHNLQSMNRNLMEMSQLAYDSAGGSKEIAEDAKATVTTLSQTIENTLAAQDAAMQALEQLALAHADEAEYWAGIAEAGAGVANPSGVAEAARDAAIAARDAAIAARDQTLVYRDATLGYKTAAEGAATSASQSATTAQQYATTPKNTAITPGVYSAKHYAETAQDIVNAGSLKWNGSARFISTSDPDNSLGVNGDFWFKREV